MGGLNDGPQLKLIERDTITTVRPAVAPVALASGPPPEGINMVASLHL